MTSVEKQVDYIIDNFEGDVFTDDPADPGGATKYGITRRTLEFYRRRLTGDSALPVSSDDVRNMTRSEAVDIGVTIFATDTNLRFILDDRLRFVVLDYAFHAGWVSAIRSLQTAAGVTSDGICGEETLGHVNSLLDSRLEATGDRIIAYRQEAMIRQIDAHPLMRRFAFGWWKRVQFSQHIMLGWETV